MRKEKLVREFLAISHELLCNMNSKDIIASVCDCPGMNYTRIKSFSLFLAVTIFVLVGKQYSASLPTRPVISIQSESESDKHAFSLHFISIVRVFTLFFKGITLRSVCSVGI